ncbi:MAG TPA: MBL fold metallo-hydrolase [Caulobacteraceae bacterium]|jgi:phosphoribosyl 1,2-cyclic phosphate phosphodiesterase|nr:MBL fold metallo-hydrolase [Caulobacteraceae bacterium]
MIERLEFTILGCGSSGGVPRADGDWGLCDPAEPRNARTRCSLMVRRLGEGADEALTTVIVDASPEFRLQTARGGATRLDALLLTHDHADQCHGIDDIRAFAIRQRALIPCWADAPTRATLSSRFGYIFEGQGLYPPIAALQPMPPLGEMFGIDGPSGRIEAVAFDQDHGPVRSLGFRFGDVAYSSDVVGLPRSAFAALERLDVWIVDALRRAPHPTHAHLDMALEWIARVRPRRAILTNMHIDLDYETLRGELPAGVEPAYDGLRLVTERQISP